MEGNHSDQGKNAGQGMSLYRNGFQSPLCKSRHAGRKDLRRHGLARIQARNRIRAQAMEKEQAPALPSKRRLGNRHHWHCRQKPSTASGTGYPRPCFPKTDRSAIAPDQSLHRAVATSAPANRDIRKAARPENRQRGHLRLAAVSHGAVDSGDPPTKNRISLATGKTAGWNASSVRSSNTPGAWFSTIPMPSVCALGVFRFWYERVRPHQNLNGKTPWEAWCAMAEPPQRMPISSPQQWTWFEEWDGVLTALSQKREVGRRQKRWSTSTVRRNKHVPSDAFCRENNKK